jgi:uncharacterized membrane protein
MSFFDWSSTSMIVTTMVAWGLAIVVLAVTVHTTKRYRWIHQVTFLTALILAASSFYTAFGVSVESQSEDSVGGVLGLLSLITLFFALGLLILGMHLLTRWSDANKLSKKAR